VVTDDPVTSGAVVCDDPVTSGSVRGQDDAVDGNDDDGDSVGTGRRDNGFDGDHDDGAASSGLSDEGRDQDDADNGYDCDNDDDVDAPSKWKWSVRLLGLADHDADVDSGDGYDAPPVAVDDSRSHSVSKVCCYSIFLAFFWNQLLVSLRQLYSSLSISVLEEFRVRRFAVIQDDIPMRQIRAIS